MPKATTGPARAKDPGHTDMIRALPVLLALALPASAQPLLQLPIDCSPGDTCFIQNYMDRDPGPDARDYTCAGLSYDGHKGTDFGLPSMIDMLEGVEVYAAAPGTVRGTRNNMIDRYYTPEEDARINGRDCGNGVVIDHGDGWETQYCHMRLGSISVSPGQQVAAGDKLGLVGLSGRTQFPHLHISIRHNGQPVDPFTPTADPGTCGLTGEDTLWADALGYQPGAILSAGFATEVPDYASIKSGTAALTALDPEAPAIVLWGYAFGGQAGDQMALTITGPGGEIYSGLQDVDRPQAQFFRAAGKRLRAPLPSGRYTGTIDLLRDGQSISKKSISIDVE